MAKMSEIDKSKLISFIITMQKTGRNVHKSLVHFAEKVTKNNNTKKIVRQVVYEIERGVALEKSLFNAGVLTKFQYSILEISPDKKTAFEKILSFGGAKKEADLFYLRVWAKAFAVCVGVFLGIYFLNKLIFIDMASNMAKTNKKMELSPFVDMILKNNETMMFIGVFLAIVFLALLLFYIETYRNNISMHYKFFRFKAIVETSYLLSTVNDLLSTGVNLNRTLGLLINTIEPKNLRNNILKIQDSIAKNNLDNFESELRRIYIDEISNFILVSGFEAKNFQESFKGAEISSKVYNEQVGKHYKEVFDLVAFSIEGIILASAVIYVVMFEVDISLGAW